MQYLLTEEEYWELKSKNEKAAEKLKATIQDLCTRVADNEPVDVYWNEEAKEPWGCILTKKDEWYCDKCPVQKACPHGKNYSK